MRERYSGESNHYPRYEFFKNEESRQELYEYCKSIAEYLHEEGIENLVIIDRSSRPLYIGVKKIWKNEYPGESQPDIYFFNPTGFKPTAYLSLEKQAELLASLVKKDNDCKFDFLEKDIEDVADELEVAYPRLVSQKDEPLLIFDTCIHSGNTLESVVNALELAGFSDVRIGAVNPAPDHARVQTDFHITDYRPAKGCYPFDQDRMVERTLAHVYSEKTEDEEKRESAIRLRKEISTIIDNKINEQSGVSDEH